MNRTKSGLYQMVSSAQGDFCAYFCSLWWEL